MTEHQPYRIRRAAILVAILGVTAFGDLASSGLAAAQQPRDQDVQIGNLQGENYQVVRARLRGRGLRVEVRWVGTVDPEQANTIANQQPAPDTTARRGSRGRLDVYGYETFISRSPSRVGVPNLLGMTLNQANRELRLRALSFKRMAQGTFRTTCD